MGSVGCIMEKNGNAKKSMKCTLAYNAVILGAYNAKISNSVAAVGLFRTMEWDETALVLRFRAPVQGPPRLRLSHTTRWETSPNSDLPSRTHQVRQNLKQTRFISAVQKKLWASFKRYMICDDFSVWNDFTCDNLWLNKKNFHNNETAYF